MGSARSPSPAGWLLATAVVAAPLLSGGWKLVVFPVIATPVVAAWMLLLVKRLERGRSLSVPFVSLALGLLAVFTAFQNAPLGDLLGVVSPRADEVWSFVSPDRRRTVSYEVGATWREAAKMMLYALAAAVASEVARRRGARRLLLPVVIAGVASLVVALGHRLFHLEAAWGVLEGTRPAWELVTTFQNPNHASAFLTLSALVATGLAVDASTRPERSALFTAAAGLAAASVIEPSKGGVLALGVGLVLFGALLWRRSRGRGGERFGVPVLFAALLLPLVGVVWQLEDVVREFGVGRGAAPLGLVEKLAAVENAWPIVQDHLWTGIGRGAYVSVYPHYQTSPLQLTFAFPENILAQLTSEWGVLVGGLAALGLVALVMGRLARAKKPYEIGAAAALGAILAHDLVDFSLELPGVALSCAVLAGALAPRKWALQLELRGNARAAGLAALPTALLVLCTYGAFRAGDLQTDLAWLTEHGRAVSSGERANHEEVHLRSHRHPANVLVAAQVAYIREVQEPPELKGALVAVNRALFLGPRYADGHVLAGRLLLRAGHRKQAFGELRRAWSLTGGRQDVLATAARWARDTEELLWAVPRDDLVADTLDGAQVARLVRVLVAGGSIDRAQDVLRALPPVELLSKDALHLIARAALMARLPKLALEVGRRGAELRPGDAMLELTLAELARRAGDLDEARRLAREVDPKGVDPAELLGLRLELAIEAQAFEEAHEVVDELRRRLPVTREHQTEIALREADLHLAERRPDRAVSVLGRAVDWSPADIEVRLARARALLALGRRGEARVDLEFVLRRQPEHRAAKTLISRTKVSN